MPPIKDSITITLDNGSEALPGDFLTGRAVLSNQNPLSLAEFSITLSGRAFTKIFRRYLIKEFWAEWRGQGYSIKRTVVFIQDPTTLSPGQHEFRFRVQLPTHTEPVKENWKLFNKWSDRDPFPGKNTVHPLPPTMAMAGTQTFGWAEGKVEYLVVSTVKKGPEAKWWSRMPQDARYFNVVAHPMVDFPADPPWQHLLHSLEGKSGNINLTVNIPEVLKQRELVPIYMKADRDQVVLEKLKVKLYTVYLVRARSVLWPEKRTKCTTVTELIKWKGGSQYIQTEPVLLEPQVSLPEEVPVQFLTFNLGCLAHWLEIKFTVSTPEKRSRKGQISNIPIKVQAWKRKETQRKPVGSDGYGGFGGQIMNDEQYRQWVTARKQNKVEVA